MEDYYNKKIIISGALPLESLFSSWGASPSSDILDLKFFIENKYLLVDANINSRIINSSGLKLLTYTSAIVADESGKKWRSYLDQSHILKSYTCTGIPEEGLTMRALDNYGSEETIYQNLSSSMTAMCGNCGQSTIATLTSGCGDMAYVCRKLSEEDQSLLIRALAFPNIFILLTDECCLGWSSNKLNSFRLEKGNYWRYYYNK